MDSDFCTVCSCFLNWAFPRILVIHTPSLVRSCSSEDMIWAYRRNAGLSIIASILPTTGDFPFLIIFLLVNPKSSLLGSLRQNTCTGLRSVTLVIITSNRMIYYTGFTLSSLHTTTVHVLTLAVTVYFLCSALSVFSSIRVFLISARNTSKIINPDTVWFRPCDSFLLLRHHYHLMIMYINIIRWWWCTS